MFKLADQFEGAVGEIIETVSSASIELEASTRFDRHTVSGTHHESRGGFRGSLDQRAVGGFGHGATEYVRQRDQLAGAGIGADGQ